MPSVQFIFDKEKDLYNIWRTANPQIDDRDFSDVLPKEILKITKGKEFAKCRLDIEKFYIKTYNHQFLNVFLETVRKFWSFIEKDYFTRLSDITKKPVYTEKFTAYLTTIFKCPYDYKENWFMFNFFSSIFDILKTCGHEIMHLQFHHYFWNDIEKQIGKDKTDTLKEALTVLLNLEFRDLWFSTDRGYSEHKELREFIVKTWEEKKDFQLLLDKCVNYLK